MFELIGNAIGSIVELITGRGSRPDPDDPCNVGNCPAARKELAAAKGGVTAVCSFLTIQIVALRAALWVLSQPIAFYVVTAIILFLLGGPLLIFAAILVTIVAVLVLVQTLPMFIPGFLKAKEREITAIAAVQADCPQECHGNLSPTPCNAVDTQLPDTLFDGLLGIDSIRDLLESLSS
jgi:hypothetical protein